ncbi:hypothetical protein DFH28DRAFT_895324 [Melampsora americana]|nr:hypothetical protein DFH28DRAFT_895324 [Melampsora americana]
MEMLWDNFLEMVSICSEVVSSNYIDTNLAEDLHDAYNWIAKEWTRIPETKFESLPIRGVKYRTGQLKPDDAFIREFERKSIYEGTVFWLSHRMHDQRRERVAATYVLRFMNSRRQHWIQHLTLSTSIRLFPRTLLIYLKRVRPLKYPASFTRVESALTKPGEGARVSM